MNDLPEPLVSADVDLSDFKFMPLEVARLRRSKMWLLAKRKPEIGFYAINLWCASWHERPAGSLDDDDDVLADLAMCDPKRWEKVRAEVLRGWIKCSDGRIYHEIVAEKANEAWKAKCAQRSRTEAARTARQDKRSSPAGTATTPVTDNVTVSVTDNATDNVTASKGQGQGEGDLSKKEIAAAALPEPPACTHVREPDPATGLIDFFDDALAETWGENRRRTWPAANDLQTARRWLSTGADDAAIKFMLRARMEAMEGRDKAPPGSMAYFDGAIEDLVANLKSGKPVERYEPPAPPPPKLKLPSGPTWDGMGKHPRFGDWYGRVLRWREKPSTWFYNAWGVAPDQPWSDVDPETLAMIDADIAVFRAANHPTVMPLPQRVA